jgi:Uma2 family endonuclease
MATLDEYLTTDYEPECELIGGSLHPKPFGTLEHMELERSVERLLERYEQRGLGSSVHELSIRNVDDVRIPDLVFVPSGARYERGILMDPPLLCVEILSPSQRLSVLFAKCETYHAWGVPYCWVLDPIGKLAWEYHQASPVRLLSNEQTLIAGEIKFAISEIFSGILRYLPSSHTAAARPE